MLNAGQALDVWAICCPEILDLGAGNIRLQQVDPRTKRRMIWNLYSDETGVHPRVLSRNNHYG
jgi:hypothetical protein